MAIGDFLNQLGVNVGDGGISFNFIGDIIIFLILCIFAGGFTYLYLNKRSFNKTIVKFREINGVTRRVGIEKAREVVLPNTSVRAFFLKSSKFYIPRPSKETSENEFWFFIREDGEWVNVGLGNLNRELKELKIKFDHTDTRMANAALKKLVDNSYKKINWIKEWAPYIGFSVIIIMLGIAGYLVMGESANVANAVAGNIDTLDSITQTLNDILSNINNIASSSGVRAA